MCYAYGFGVEKDLQKAAKCYREAAGNSTIAQLALGVCYADGIGVEKDKIKAEDLLTKADLSVEGPYGFWDKNEVLAWLREAGERGHAGAQDTLGDYYYNRYGIRYGIEKDYAEAVKWYRKATEIEYDDSALHDSSFRGKKKRVESMYRIYIKANAYMGLARIYLHGGNGVGQDEVEKDEAEAVKWFRKVAEYGNAGCEGMVMLGICYFNGVGVKKDEAEAIKWFRRAAKQDNYYSSKAVSQGN